MPEPSDPGGEIRLAPTGTTMTPDQAQLSIADAFFVKKAYNMAAPEYEKYLGLYPQGPDRATVLYRLGESYRLNGAANAAKNSYETLLAHFSNGDFIGPAAYRLADLYYEEKNYSGALGMYRRATVRLQEPKLANSAKFFTARCLEALGQKLEARMTYEELANSAENNPFHDASRLSLALLLKDANRTADALKHVQALAKQAQSPELKAEATVRSGLWLLDLEQPAKAADELRKALEMPGIAKWKEVAQMGLLQVLFDSEKYQEVIDRYASDAKEFSAEVKPQLMTLVAKAQAKLGKSKEALSTLDEVIKDFPTSPYARDAGYERLVALYQTNDSNLVAEIDKFLVSNPDAPKRDQVQLMKAETLFKKQDYAAAAPIYELLDGSRALTPALKGEALFKLAFCQIQTRDFERAVKTYTSFLSSFPTHKSVATALFQRGVANLRLKATAAALKDFDQLISRHPKAKERETALQQKALVLGQQNDNERMAETFRILLKEYPDTPPAVAAEGNYWIGWVAYEKKDYQTAAPALAKARELDKEQYFERASLRVMLSYFYQEDREAVAREIDIYTKGGGKTQVPEEVLRWLGQTYAKAAATSSEDPEERTRMLEQAAKYMEMLIRREDAEPDDYLFYARTQLDLEQFEKAVEPLEKRLESVKDPLDRVQALLLLGEAQVGLKKLDAAQKTADAALTLQPDGVLNARARVLAGDIDVARGESEKAAKIYESVSVVIDDESVTPGALEKAVSAYRMAGWRATRSGC
jgi:TolA-binding protein